MDLRLWLALSSAQRVGRQPPAEMFARRACGRSKVAWRHGSGAQVLHAIERFIEGIDDARIRQYIERAAGSLDGFLAAQHVGPTRRDQHQIVKPHRFHGPRSGAHVAGMAGLDEYKTGANGHKRRQR